MFSVTIQEVWETRKKEIGNREYLKQRNQKLCFQNAPLFKTSSVSLNTTDFLPLVMWQMDG